jgi:hypothetical protein
MSPRYWIKISLGALVIFAVGMVFVGAGHKGTAWADHMAHSASTISIPLVFVPFRLDGESIGSIKRLDIMRDAPEQVSGALISVKLHDHGGLPAESCALAIDDLDDIGDGATFYCADHDTRLIEELVPFGTVEFQPSGAQRVLLLPLEVVEEIGNEMGQDVKVNIDSRYAARVEQRVERIVAQQEANARATEAAISIRIVDALNDAGILLNADSNGLVMSIRDGSNGTKVLMKADADGFAMTVDENGESTVQMRADSQGLVFNVKTDAGAEVIAPKADN